MPSSLGTLGGIARGVTRHMDRQDDMRRREEAKQQESMNRQLIAQYVQAIRSGDAGTADSIESQLLPRLDGNQQTALVNYRRDLEQGDTPGARDIAAGARVGLGWEKNRGWYRDESLAPPQQEPRPDIRLRGTPGGGTQAVDVTGLRGGETVIPDRPDEPGKPDRSLQPGGAVYERIYKRTKDQLYDLYVDNTPGMMPTIVPGAPFNSLAELNQAIRTMTEQELQGVTPEIPTEKKEGPPAGKPMGLNTPNPSNPYPKGYPGLGATPMTPQPMGGQEMNARQAAETPQPMQVTPEVIQGRVEWAQKQVQAGKSPEEILRVLGQNGADQQTLDAVRQAITPGPGPAPAPRPQSAGPEQPEGLGSAYTDDAHYTGPDPTKRSPVPGDLGYDSGFKDFPEAPEGIAVTAQGFYDLFGDRLLDMDYEEILRRLEDGQGHNNTSSQFLPEVAQALVDLKEKLRMARSNGPQGLGAQ